MRSAVLAVLTYTPTPTSPIIDAVMKRIDSGQCMGCHIADRHEVRTAMEGLAALRLIDRHETGETEPSRGRFRGGFSRAVRGSVLWSRVRE